MVKGLHEIIFRQQGKYRADFVNYDLGELSVPPEIRADFENVQLTARDENSSSGYRSISNTPRLFGKIAICTYMLDKALELIEKFQFHQDVLYLRASRGDNCQILRFPAAQLLPQWEFEPSFTGVHHIKMHWLLSADADGKLFYTA